MKKKFLTWNTSLYNEKSSSPDLERYNSILNVVKEKLEIENAIVFLQEIPFYSNETWKEHILFSNLIKDLQDYDIKFNVSRERQIMMTIAIAVKDHVEPAPPEVYPNCVPTNRECAIMFKSLKIMGIHANPGADNVSYLKSLNAQADIILGDFNAGNYPEAENRVTFNNILKEHICICNMPTRVDERSKRRTCIDHIFVREDLVSRCSNMVVHEDVAFSDHFPLSFEINL